jgi:hypothetical protein
VNAALPRDWQRGYSIIETALIYRHAAWAIRPMNNLALAIHFILQIAVILLFCRLVGAIALRFGQPQVVAEMLAGVLLGPSLFDLLLPEAQQWLFPWDTT